ncbi:hypothetical protein CO168_01335, partial [Candidatus Shapirobacteria bacterium CG_4_9_14_3_um_filter_36_12]
GKCRKIKKPYIMDTVKGKHKKLWRKECKDTTSLGEWSRMLHRWWRLSVSKKIEFKRNGE